MLSRSLPLFPVCVAVLASVAVLTDTRAAEPVALPPLAPVPTDVRAITVVSAETVLPGNGRGEPVLMNAAGEPAIVSGEVYSEGEMVYVEGDGGEYYSGPNYNPDEAAVRISDLPAEMQSPMLPGIKPSRMLCPHCRYCPHGLPYHECPECEPTRKDIRKYTRQHGLRLPPDYGWAPPARAPIERISIDYYRAFPGAWTGNAAVTGPAIVRPHVYWPTDTTQMGYTYQHTPMWMPYPGMVPPVPQPSQWHLPLVRTGPGVNLSGRHGHGPHAAAHAPVPTQQWNPESVESMPQENIPEEQLVPQELPPTQAAQLPTGPELHAPATSPSLAPVPF